MSLARTKVLRMSYFHKEEFQVLLDMTLQGEGKFNLTARLCAHLKGGRGRDQKTTCSRTCRLQEEKRVVLGAGHASPLLLLWTGSFQFLGMDVTQYQILTFKCLVHSGSQILLPDKLKVCVSI